MYDLGVKIANNLLPNDILLFYGDLGAGKTTMIKGIAEAATGIPKEQVNSPTFVYLNIYEGPLTVYHFDLYRIQSAEDFFEMGFEEFLAQGGVCCFEWPEKIESFLPQERYSIKISHQGEEKRLVTLDDKISL